MLLILATIVVWHFTLDILHRFPIKCKMSESEKKAAWDVLFDSDKDEVSILKKQAKEYTENTSIHGLVYLGESDRSFIER